MLVGDRPDRLTKAKVTAWDDNDGSFVYETKTGEFQNAKYAVIGSRRPASTLGDKFEELDALLDEEDHGHLQYAPRDDIQVVLDKINALDTDSKAALKLINSINRLSKI